MGKSSYYSRQNHKKALTLLKAGLYCFRRENFILYLIIFFSILFCLSGLVFSMLPQLLKMNDVQNDAHVEFMELCSSIIRWAGLGSGVFVIVQMFLKVVTNRLHIEGVNAMEKFDLFVYEIVQNKLIMRPISDAQLDDYSLKIHKRDEYFHNSYFSAETPDDRMTVYNNQREIFLNEYHLLQYAKSKFFVWIWGLFFVGIFAFAILINSDFLTTLLDIFFPSISIISYIASSILSYNTAMRFLNNTLNYYESNAKASTTDKTSDMTLRLNQDAIFAYRLRCFTVPMFLIKRYDKSRAKRKRLELAKDDSFVPRTSPFYSAYNNKPKRRNKNKELLTLRYEDTNENNATPVEPKKPIERKRMPARNVQSKRLKK